MAITARWDGNGRALAGSQRHMQSYVNVHTQVLNTAVKQMFALGSDIAWVSPLHRDAYREYRDLAFLKAVGQQHAYDQLKAFWPDRGPVWDALAVAGSNREAVLLVEAKSHIPEVFSTGCKASSPASIDKIARGLQATKAWLGVVANVDWLEPVAIQGPLYRARGSLYQTANRLAHLFFFREVLHVETYLINLYFTDDPRSPTSEEAWRSANLQIKQQLGLGQVPYSADLLLPALTAEEQHIAL